MSDERRIRLTGEQFLKELDVIVDGGGGYIKGFLGAVSSFQAAGAGEELERLREVNDTVDILGKHLGVRGYVENLLKNPEEHEASFFVDTENGMLICEDGKRRIYVDPRNKETWYEMVERGNFEPTIEAMHAAMYPFAYGMRAR